MELDIKRPVVWLDFSGGHFYEYGGLYGDLLAQLEDIELLFELVSGTDVPLPARLRRLLAGLYRKFGERVVVLIDEYDKPI